MGDSENLETQKWYHANLSRQEAEEILRGSDPGTFVVRPSTSHHSCFALSYKTSRGDISHSLIQKTPLGYKLPDDSPVFPTLGGLLKTCKFLAWDEPPSDQNVAVLVEAFPNVSTDTIMKALKSTRNDVVAAIDYLLTNTSGSPTPAKSSAVPPQPKPASSQPKSSPAQSIPPSNPSRSNPPVAQSPPHQQASSQPMGPIESVFVQLSKNRHIVKNVRENWPTLERPTAVAATMVSPTLEQNLIKILQNTNHPMGKKVDTFALAFRTTYDSFSLPDNVVNNTKAVQEINQFITSMISSITSKVSEFATPHGVLVVWKAVQNVVFLGTFAPAFQTFQQRYSDMDAAKDRCLQNLKGATLADLSVQPKFLLPKVPSPYSKAIECLQGISFVKTIYEKLTVLVSTCTIIVENIKEYYKVNPAPENTYLVPTAEDLLPIFTYVLIKSQVPFAYSELIFVKDFIHEEMKKGFEGFALSAYEASLNGLEKINIQISSAPKQSEFLLEFDDPPPRNEEARSSLTSSTKSPPTFTSQNSFQHLDEALNSSFSNFNLNQSGNAPSNQPPQEEPKFETLKKAEKAYVNALKSMHSVDSCNQLAVYYNTKGKMTKAIMYCNQALLIDPNNDTAKRNLVLFSQSQNKPNYG